MGMFKIKINYSDPTFVARIGENPGKTQSGVISCSC